MNKVEKRKQLRVYRKKLGNSLLRPKMTLHDWAVFAGAIGAASFVCTMLRQVSPQSDFHVPLIFVLAVLVVSLMTEGYFYAFLAALVSVVTVNFAFTYPYQKVDFSLTGYPLTFLTMLAVGLAISVLMQQVREQEQARLDFERERVRANLLRAMSHDLRTPLTSISGSISTVMEESSTLSHEEKMNLLEGAKEDAEWLRQMVENLLSITRIGEGPVARLQKQDELLEEIIGESVQKFRIHNPDVPVRVRVPDTVVFVPADAMLIEQVLMNLLDNAVRHGENLTWIRVTAELGSGVEEGYVAVSVEDDGGGVPENEKEHLFDGTIQAETDTRGDTSRGMGIGLTVCRTIIEAHGGHIEEENKTEGACFRFTLPVSEEDMESGDEDTEEEEK